METQTFGPKKSFKMDINISTGIYLFSAFSILIFFLLPIGVVKREIIEIFAMECTFGCLFFAIAALGYYAVPFAYFTVDDEKVIQKKFGIKKVVEWSEIKKIEKKEMPPPFIYFGSIHYIAKTPKGRLFFSDKLENAEKLWSIINEKFENAQKNAA